jgi:hypothetical protein
MRTIKKVAGIVFSRLALYFAFTTTMVLAYQNCGRFTPMNSEYTQGSSSTGSTGSPGTVDLPALMEGKSLYTQNCASCHGSVESSSKRSRDTSQIRLAINSIPQMGAISLSDAQIALIAQALSPEPTSIETLLKNSLY